MSTNGRSQGNDELQQEPQPANVPLIHSENQSEQEPEEIVNANVSLLPTFTPINKDWK